MTKKHTIKKKSMIEALEKSLGIVTTACRVTGISRETHYRWMREDDDYKAAVIDINDIALDFAESQLHQQIKDKDTAATIFYLKTKGKARGYVERMQQEISGPGGGKIVLKLDDGCEPIKGSEGNAGVPGELGSVI